MALVAVTAIGADRPGIVAEVTRILLEQGCNLEDTSMTILRGHFAMTLVVSAPGDETELERAFGPVQEKMGLVVSVRPIGPEQEASGSGHPFVVSVYGADRPGIVHAVA